MVNTNTTPLVSVCMVTYNHENFIAQAIEGVVMQAISFPIELLIGDDCSTDKTREICLKYKDKYPDILKLNFQEKNVGGQANFVDTIKKCSGKYIALCEGDDYWTNPQKLQQQIDFLESNPDYTISTHNSVIFAHNGKMLNIPALDKTTYTLEDIISLDWSVMTASIVFRKEDFNITNWFVNVKNGDYALQLLLLTKGNMNYIPEYMSVYRRHLGGATAIFNPFYSANALYFLLNKFDKETEYKYKTLIKKKLQRIYANNRKTAKESKLKKQQIGLSIVLFFSKLGIDVFPLVSKFSIFQK